MKTNTSTNELATTDSNNTHPVKYRPPLDLSERAINLAAGGIVDGREACQILGCGRTQLWKLERDGHLLTLMVGGRKKYYRLGLVEYLARQARNL